MKIRVHITRDPLAAGGTVSTDGETGAVVEFAGVVRSEEDSRVLAGLEYEAYESMARSEMERIAAELSETYPCRSMEISHRLGRVPAGEASILVRIEAKHRAEAFGMLSAFMDRLKRDVPIWKKAWS